MRLKSALRLISFVMLIVAIIFLVVALTHPELGTVFYIGNLKIGSEIWRACYAVYAIVMITLFGVSCCVRK